MYIFWFLHQTTTYTIALRVGWSCISFDSYIKPQLPKGLSRFLSVVYLLIPTSNHNSSSYLNGKNLLYIFWFLHQTTTAVRLSRISILLYIFWFLHQTTTFKIIFGILGRCISFDSYIKPQLYSDIMQYVSVVYLLIPTSNHNLQAYDIKLGRVVYLLIPTSNHNYSLLWKYFNSLYIFWFLHQTTTVCLATASQYCCISFDSYIKPQPSAAFIMES